MIALLDRVILDVGPCLSWLQILLSIPFLPARFLLRNQLTVLWELLVTVSFSLSAFKILSFSLILGNLIMMCLGMCFLGSNFFGTLWASWTSWKSISFARLGKFSFIICSNKFSTSCSFSSPSVNPMIRMFECLKLSQRLLSFSLFFWILEFLFLYCVLIECLFLPSAPNCWFKSRFPSCHFWFSVYFALFHFG